MSKDHSIANYILRNKQPGKNILPWKILAKSYVHLAFKICLRFLKQKFPVLKYNVIHYTLWWRSWRGNNHLPFILYSSRGYQINYFIWFHLLLSNIAKPTCQVVAAQFTLEHREAQWFASGNSVAKPLA